jgi:DNA polymerase elongation subunit (family B)
MANFYTNVSRYGNMLLYRGIENGQRVQKKIKYKPTLFVATTKATKWKSLDGRPVAPLQFESMRDAKDWIQQNKNVSGRHIYGNTKYQATLVNDLFPGQIEFDRSKINVTTIDIEVQSDGGFPVPELAEKTVTAICLKNNIDNTYYVWGLGSYNVEESLMKDNRVVYKKCVDEQELLIDFINHWATPSHTPDVITGWNSKFFDIPYLVNRIKRVFGPDLGEQNIKKLSPWGMVESREVAIGYKSNNRNQTYDFQGISHMDYMEVFKKFGYAYGQQESYSLNNIAHVVLGEKKLSYEEHGSLFDLYKADHQKFIDYNIKDVELVDRLEDKMGLITLAITMAYTGGVNYTDTFGTTAIWDSIIFRDLYQNNVIVPFPIEQLKGDYPGGYVKEPQVGMHDHVVSFDLNSLYPSIIMQYNMSPETILNKTTAGVDVENVLKTTHIERPTNECIAVGGQHFRTDVQGTLPKIIEEMYTERVDVKKAMIQAQKDLQKVDKNDKQELYRIQKDISLNENRQMAIKILLNSLYGALGNRYFRFFDQRVAEAITLSGQAIIRWGENAINDYLNKALKSSTDYVLAIDTDSLYVGLGPLVQKTKPNNPIDFLDKVSKEALEPVFIKAYQNYFDIFGGLANKMVMGREVIADRGIYLAKKRYILNVIDNEGVRYATPKIKTTGVEANKSSTPTPCREALKEMFKLIISSDEATVQAAVQQFKDHYFQLRPDQIAFPRGANNITGCIERRSYRNQAGEQVTVESYKKGTPIHVRAALAYNWLRRDLDLKQYPELRNGDKLKFLYLKPGKFKENVIAFPDFLPKEFNLEQHIDKELQFQKTFTDAIEPILNAIGWTSIKVNSLEDFFG